MRGFILYDGPSEIDGQPIVCIATDPDQSRLNAKTQRVVQTYILRADVGPIEAIRTGDDISICGDCTHRGAGGERSCYVQVWSAPRNVWLAYRRGKYDGIVEDLSGLIVRLGAYGDPAAVPISVWKRWLGNVTPIGYTHQWRDPRFNDLARWCMASCDNEEDYAEAKRLGWRTFRVRNADEPTYAREIKCPASAEMGKKTNCAECRACGGWSAKAACDITIVAHGDRGKVEAFRRKNAVLA
jgi:hypothetical protein